MKIWSCLPASLLILSCFQEPRLSERPGALPETPEFAASTLADHDVAVLLAERTLARKEVLSSDLAVLLPIDHEDLLPIDHEDLLPIDHEDVLPDEAIPLAPFWLRQERRCGDFSFLPGAERPPWARGISPLGWEEVLVGCSAQALGYGLNGQIEHWWFHNAAGASFLGSLSNGLSRDGTPLAFSHLTQVEPVTRSYRGRWFLTETSAATAADTRFKLIQVGDGLFALHSGLLRSTDGDGRSARLRLTNLTYALAPTTCPYPLSGRVYLEDDLGRRTATVTIAALRTDGTYTSCRPSGLWVAEDGREVDLTALTDARGEAGWPLTARPAPAEVPPGETGSPSPAELVPALEGLFRVAPGGAQQGRGYGLTILPDRTHVSVGFDQATGHTAYALAFDDRGRVAWRFDLGGSGQSEGHAVVPGQGGGAILLATYAANGGSLQATEGVDVLAVRLDASGQELGRTSHDVGPIDRVQYAIASPHGGYAFVGTVEEGGVNRGLVLAAQADGGENFQLQLHQEEREVRLEQILALPNGDYAVLGTVKPFLEGIDSQFLLARISAQGEEVWRKVWGGPYEDEGKGLVLTREGMVFVTGCSSSNAEAQGLEAVLGDVLTRIQAREVYLATFDLEGTLRWEAWHGEPYEDAPHNLIVLSDGDVLVVGTERTGPLSPPVPKVLRCAPDGAVRWSHRLELGREAHALAVVEHPLGFLLSGFSKHPESGEQPFVLAITKDGQLLAP